MNIVLVGSLMAATSAFRKLEMELKARDNEVYSFLGGGKLEFVPELEDRIQKADFVLIGMATPESNAVEELRAAKIATQLGKRYGFFADVDGVAVGRSHFAPYRDGAKLLFVPNQEEAEQARPHYPNVRIVVSGNPDWDDFAYPARSREEVRQKFQVKERQRLIMFVGDTADEMIYLHWWFLMEALWRIDPPSPIASRSKVLLTVHPGDPRFKKDPDIYKSFEKISDPCFDVQIVTRDIMPSSEILAGVDVVLVPPGSIVGQGAVLLRKSVICLGSRLALDGLEKSIGSREWPPCVKGAQLQVANAQELAKALLNIGQHTLRENQEKAFPLPAGGKGAIVKLMANEIHKMYS